MATATQDAKAAGLQAASLEAMSLEQRVGQMVMAGFPGTEAGPEAEVLLAERHIGGVILMGRNMTGGAQVRALTRQLQELAARSGAPAPLWIAADQEGGQISRVAGTTLFPGGMALGAAGSEELAQAFGRETGRQLRALGIQVNFAPVADVNSNPDNPVIGARSFGEDPGAVAALAAAYARGLAETGVLAVGKHFPGHGDTELDSHIDLPTVPHQRQRLAEVELLPFRALIEAGVPALMTAHVTFPAVDPTPGMPATLSQPVMTGLLREELGFDGILFTDALEMKAISDRFGSAEAAVRAVQAGADVLLVAWPADWRMAVEVVSGLVEAVRAGSISEERINQSVERILAAKEAQRAAGLFGAAAEGGLPDELAEAGRALAERIAAASITVVRQGEGRLPLPKGGGEILVIEPAAERLLGRSDAGPFRLAAYLEERGYSVRSEVIPLRPGAELRQSLLEAAAASAGAVAATWQAWRYGEQAELVRALSASGRPVWVVALGEPYDLRAFPEADTFLAAYSPVPASLEAAADVLAGRPASGSLPVTVETDESRRPGPSDLD